MSSKPISEKTTLEVDNIDVNYGKIRVLKSISLAVKSGLIVAVIGANGSGKSTLLKTVSGLLKPLAGEIHYENYRIDKLPPHKIAQLSLTQVPEGRRLFSKMSVLENLQIGVRNKNKYLKNLDIVFNYFPILKTRLNQLAGTLSGGEQQMLAIGRALMSEPKLLVMDEPTLGLSPIMVSQIGEIITKINADGTTILLSEQNAYLALQLSDEAYVMETGTIVLQGQTKALIENESVKSAYLSAG